MPARSEPGLRPGLLLVGKPSGPTSRQVVNRLVGILGVRRVGHAGTLDPFAEGLLILVWGKATALVPYIQAYSKTYRARARFGRVTDTQDRTGRILADRSAEGLTREAVEARLPEFRGDVVQLPPMHSALKRGGTRLYQLARSGLEVERPSRVRRIDRFELLEWDPPCADLEVTCASGTYVRTLAHDLGRRVGTGASLDRLVRTRVGPFRLDDALSFDRIEDLDREVVVARALDPAEALPDWPAVRLSPEQARAVSHGSLSDESGQLSEAGEYRLLDEGGELIALARGGNEARLLRVFSEPGS